MIWINILIGLVLLFAGRRLFWLFVACVGFASGYDFAQQIWGIHSPILVLILSIAAGALGAIIAIFFQKLAIVVAGFAAGGYLVLSLFNQFAGLPAELVGLPYIIGGIIGAITMNKQEGKSRPPGFLSTHPATETRIADIKKYLPEVLPYYGKTKKLIPGFSKPGSGYRPTPMPC